MSNYQRVQLWPEIPVISTNKTPFMDIYGLYNLKYNQLEYMAITVDETRAYFPRPLMPSTLNRGPGHRKSRAALVRERPGCRCFFFFFRKSQGKIPVCLDTHMLHGAGIFTCIWVIFRAHVGKYSIHGAYGICWVKSNSMQQYHNELILSYLLVINMVQCLVLRICKIRRAHIQLQNHGDSHVTACNNSRLPKKNSSLAKAKRFSSARPSSSAWTFSAAH